MDIPLRLRFQEYDDCEGDFDDFYRGRRLNMMKTWSGPQVEDSQPTNNNLLPDLAKNQNALLSYLSGIKGKYGSLDNGSLHEGSPVHTGSLPDSSQHTEAQRLATQVFENQQSSCGNGEPHVSSLSRSYGLIDDYEIKDQYDDEGLKISWPETTPLLDSSFKLHKYFNEGSLPYQYDIYPRKNPGKMETIKETMKGCWENIPWGFFNKIKIIVLTLTVIMTTVAYASGPFFEYKWSQFSLSTYQPLTFKQDNSKFHYPIVKVYLRGSFLYKHSSEKTNNAIITVINPLTNDTQKWAIVVPTLTELYKVPEDIYHERFEFTDQPIPDEYVITVEGNYPYSIPLDMSVHVFPSSINSSIIYAAVILCFVYILIIFDLVHRTVAAMMGSLMAVAALALLNEKPDLSTIITWMDFETMALLFGMMVLVSILTDTGFFDWIALMAYKMAKGKTWPLITMLCIFAAVISAFLDNVTTIMLLAPVTIRLCEVIDIDPVHVLIAEVMFSNIGGAATAIGDPPNVIILSNRDIIDAEIGFGVFTLHMLFGAILAAVATYALIRFIYRNKELLRSADPPKVTELKHEMKVWQRVCNNITVASREESTVKALLMQKIVGLDFQIKQAFLEYKKSARGYKVQVKELEEIYYIRDKWLLAKCLLVLTVVIIMFILSSFLTSFYLTVGWIPIMGALWLLVMSDTMDLEAILHRIEWATLIFFAALFVLMEAITQLGLIDFLTEQITNIVRSIDEDYRLALSIIIILWVSALASSFIDNIPYTTAMLPVIIQLSGDSDLDLPLAPLVWALAFGACLGGNGTLIGASCNVVCAGIAENHGFGFSFGKFFKVGCPTMLLSTFMVMLYLLTIHIVFDWD